MSYPYSIFYLMMIGTSLFAMDQKNSSTSNSKTTYSYHMEPIQVEFNNDEETGKSTTTYKYADGSKSSYITYKDSFDKKN